MNKTIVTIDTAGAGAYSGRNIKNLSASLTLDDLWDCLMKNGNEQVCFVTETATKVTRYNRRRKTWKKCSRKTRHAKNDLKKRHANTNFIFATKEYLKNIAIMFWPDSALLLSIDDKTKVPIGITAATKQAPMVMHMIYEIRLPDHDVAIATSYKLIPSAYVACEITKFSSKI